MTEVSCRAFSFFAAGERSGLFDLGRVLEGLPVKRAELEDPTNRVAWNVWAQITERAASQLGNDRRRLHESGRLVLETGENGYAGYLGTAAALFTTAEGLADLIARWVGPSLYRSHTFEVEHVDELRFRFETKLRPGFTPCPPWFQILPGAFEVLPRFMGLPDAAVAIERVDGVSARLVLTAPASRTLTTRLRRTWAGLRSARTLGDELAFQQRQLTATLEALRRSEGGFRAALDAFPAYVALHDDGTLLYVNPALSEVLGRPATELEGQPLASLLHPDDRGQFEGLQQGLDAGVSRPKSKEIRLVRRDDSVVFVEAQPFARFDFGARGARGFFALDATERRRMEETNRILMSTLPDLVMRVARDGTLVDVQGGNHRAEEAEGLQPLIGGRDDPRLRAIASPKVIEEGRRAIVAALESGMEQRRELISEEDERTFELRAVPRSDGAEAIVLVRDVTQQTRDERQLAITERMASLGSLAAGIAHEINNPLTFLTANHELLDEGLAHLERGEPVDLAELRQLVHESREGTKRVKDIVASLRTFSRVEVKVVPTPIDPVRAFERALAICATELRHRAVLERALTRVGSVLGDESQLIQVLVNLLMNALQSFSDEQGGTIRVVSRADSGGRIRLEVQDTGSGIAPHVQKRIFDPFFTTKPPGKGTGLGLSISDRIVREMGGELRVMSEVGRGSTFSVLLPPASFGASATPASKDPPLTAPTPSVPLDDRMDSPKWVLVVDDDPLVLRALVRVLERAGHRVIAADGAEIALAKLGEVNENEIDLILCDVMMPHISGVEFFERVRVQRAAMADRFVFMTGGAFADAIRKTVLATDRPLLDKPLALNDLTPYLSGSRATP
jgi:PAS domain S-box-containing protein